MNLLMSILTPAASTIANLCNVAHKSTVILDAAISPDAAMAQHTINALNDPDVQAKLKAKAIANITAELDL